jgi:hypothetical protein
MNNVTFSPGPLERPKLDDATGECVCGPLAPHFIDDTCTTCREPKTRYVAENLLPAFSFPQCIEAASVNGSSSLVEVEQLLVGAIIAASSESPKTSKNDVSGGRCACPETQPHFVNDGCINCCDDKHGRTKFVPSVEGEMTGSGQCHCPNENEHVIESNDKERLPRCGTCATANEDKSNKFRFVSTGGDFGKCECQVGYNCKFLF